jgi:hypothetical protein
VPHDPRALIRIGGPSGCASQFHKAKLRILESSLLIPSRDVVAQNRIQRTMKPMVTSSLPTNFTHLEVHSHYTLLSGTGWLADRGDKNRPFRTPGHRW